MKRVRLAKAMALTSGFPALPSCTALIEYKSLTSSRPARRQRSSAKHICDMLETSRNGDRRGVSVAVPRVRT